MGSNDKDPGKAFGLDNFFRRDVADPRPAGPQTSEEWWEYLCAQADARRQKHGIGTADVLIDWRRQVIVPREKGVRRR